MPPPGDGREGALRRAAGPKEGAFRVCISLQPYEIANTLKSTHLLKSRQSLVTSHHLLDAVCAFALKSFFV